MNTDSKKNAKGRGKKRAFRVILLCLAAAAVLFFLCRVFYPRPLDGISFSKFYTDRNNRFLNISLSSDDKYRIRSALGDFPPELIEAVLLQEDQYFYGHWGINPGAILRSFWETYVKKNRPMGASTITMQLARLRYGLYTRSIPGKVQQIILALLLEVRLSKDEILEAYLNLAPYGGNIEGAAAASWYFFGKDPRELSRGEILTLAVIPQNPSKRSPLGGEEPEDLLRSRRILYKQWLSRHPEDALLEAEINMPQVLQGRFPRKAPHLAEYLAARFPDRGKRTTINSSFQELCERELKSYVVQNKSLGIVNGSILLADYTTMEVLAAVGSADYYNDEINGQVNGFNSKRSPGSTLKPFIYALALEQGLIHPQTLLKDIPMGFSEYEPDNFQSVFKGPVAAWYALVDSRNIPAIQLARAIHNPDLYDCLKTAGVTGLKGKEHYGLSIVLGSADLTMMELASLYGALANGGIKRELRFFADNATPRNEARLLSPAASFITLKMLERNPGPDAAGSNRPVPVAYKTGTSIGFKDSWSIAVFDRYLLCVWLGNFSGEGNPAFVGRQTATPLGFHIIDALLGQIRPSDLLPPRPVPAEVSEIDVCAVSGGLPDENCPRLVKTFFIPGVSPISRCRIHRRVYIDTRTGYRTDETEGAYIRSEVREFWPTDLQEIFIKAGLPRLNPPPYPPDSGLNIKPGGFPPSIISPLSTSYVLRRGDERFNKLVLLAGADQDTEELFWFANTMFIGRAPPKERLVWTPDPGQWNLTVVDSRGRSSGITVNVSWQD